MATQRAPVPALAARVPIAVGAALALADASVVTLALPEILERLDTTVEGLAAVIGVYTLVLAGAVLVAVPARRWLGSAVVGALGMLLFAVASVMCGVSDGLTGLLVSRALQAVGAGFGLVAAFELLTRGSRTRPGPPAGLWVAAAVFGTAIGPALGGALTEAFDWRAIFLAQAPFGVLAALACLVPQPGRDDERAGRAGDVTPPATDGPGGRAAADPAGTVHGRLPGDTAGPDDARSAADAWPLPSPRPARSTARPAGHDDPTRVHGTGHDETLVDPAGGARPARDPDAATVRRPLEDALPGQAGGPGGAASGAAVDAPGRRAGTGRPADGAYDPQGPGDRPAAAPRRRPSGDHARAGVALALVSAALTAVVFLLVLLLVTGWAVQPLKAAVGVSLLPVAAVVGWRIPGDPWVRASAGSAFVGAGILALAALPDVGWKWVVLPQLMAGIGMGMALPALAGELLPERTTGQAGGLLALRHVGITVALVALAPVIAQQLDTTIDRTREQVAALVLDARLPPQPKLESIGAALGDVSADDPRGSLRQALDSQAPKFAEDEDDRAVYARLTVRADETLVTAVNGAFRTAFLITGGLALLAALLVLPPVGRHPALVIALAAAALAGAGVQVLTARSARPEPVVIADPCQDRRLPNSGGIDGFVQDAALGLLDRAACRYGSTREALALAFGDDDLAEQYKRDHGVDPRKEIPSLLGGAIGGGDGAPGALENLVRRLIPGG